MSTLRYISLTIMLLCSVLMASAQTSVRSYWETAPDFISEEKDLVLNALDSLSKGQIKLPYHLYENLELIEADSTTLSLRNTSLSTWAMRLLPMVNGTSLIAVIRTVEQPIADSSIDFYTPDWKHIDGAKLITLPLAKEWATPRSSDPERIEQLLYPLYMTLHWLPKAGLSVRASLPILLNDVTREEDKKLIEQLPPITLHWDGARFIRNK